MTPDELTGETTRSGFSIGARSFALEVIIPLDQSLTCAVWPLRHPLTRPG